jgi:hypothetical protein
MTREQLLRLSNRELAEEYGRVATKFLKQQNAQSVQGESLGVKMLVTGLTAFGRLVTRGGTLRMIRERLDCGAVSREEVVALIIETSNNITTPIIKTPVPQSNSPKPIVAPKPSLNLQDRWNKMTYEQRIDYAKTIASISPNHVYARRLELRANVEQMVDALSLEEFRKHYNTVVDVPNMRVPDHVLMRFNASEPPNKNLNPNDKLSDRAKEFDTLARIVGMDSINSPTYRDMLVVKIMFNSLSKS